jgi:hypothetical protein
MNFYDLGRLVTQISAKRQWACCTNVVTQGFICHNVLRAVTPFFYAQSSLYTCVESESMHPSPKAHIDKLIQY